MRTLKFLVLALGLALTVTACGAPPKADLDAAKAAMDPRSPPAPATTPPRR